MIRAAWWRICASDPNSLSNRTSGRLIAAPAVTGAARIAMAVLLAQDPYDVYTKARSRAVGNNRPSGHVAQVMAEVYNHKMKRNVLPQWHEMDRRSKRRV